MPTTARFPLARFVDDGRVKVLAALADGTPSSAAALRERVDLTRQRVYQVLRELEVLGWVEATHPHAGSARSFALARRADSTKARVTVCPGEAAVEVRIRCRTADER